jgi:hypothetical protein
LLGGSSTINFGSGSLTLGGEIDFTLNQLSISHGLGFASNDDGTVTQSPTKILIKLADGFTASKGEFFPLIAAENLGFQPADHPSNWVQIDPQTYKVNFGKLEFDIPVSGGTYLVPTVMLDAAGDQVLGLQAMNQAIYVNWAVDREIVVKDGPLAMEIPTGGSVSPRDVAAEVGVNKNAVLDQVAAIFYPSAGQDNAIPIPIFDSGNQKFSPGTPQNALTVDFSSSSVVTSNGPIGGVAWNVGPLAPTIPGIDLYNLRSDGEVTVILGGCPASCPPVSTIDHEAGHGLGLVHTFKDGVPQVMNYNRPDKVNFYNGALPWVEPPVPGGTPQDYTQNAAYALLKYTAGYSDEELKELGVDPGDCDTILSTCVFKVLKFAFKRITFDEDVLYNVSIVAEENLVEGSGEWTQLFSLPEVQVSDLIGLTQDYLDKFPIRILASTVPGNDWNLIFGLGDCANPQVDLQNVGGAFSGSIFEYNAAGGGCTVVGGFSATSTDVGFLTPQGVVPESVPEPQSLALCLLGLSLGIWTQTYTKIVRTKRRKATCGF